ncbi:alpha/beta hydrolase [Erysipelothrix sp. strain 2 (EsS2-6-Brazil)]|uniref:alpha/beta hydrolase n=1 Tax=Erysipelothrix sp. strain 2 (EsS2-6-Brazil) TaxID=2500549 RepID=UPI00190C61B7|nr:alpha/beta hydrolase [Erysipelothrix sp. strain 2 (EsS2-6-Brazil)]MBK2402936.1 alpha/beta hydrolase [Erysipelothrix sp. strain 2 (EsS2-6-Brazil)]
MSRASIKRGLLAVLALVLLIVGGVAGYFIVDPSPSAYLIRKVFEGGLAVKPHGYELIESEVDAYTDLTYESTAGRNTFDLFGPKNSQKLPTIIWVHGGAFVGGDKHDNYEYAVQLAHQGYRVINLNYDLAPEAVYPSPVHQVGEAITYLQTHADLFGLDINNIILAGDSAGAHIISQFMMVQVDPAYAQKLNQNVTLNPSSIKGMALFCGPYDLNGLLNMQSSSGILDFFVSRLAWAYMGEKAWMDTDYVESLSILNHVTSDFPPTFITDGNQMSFMEDGLKMQAKLESLDVPVTSVFYEGVADVLGHEYQFKMDNPYSVHTFEEFVGFLNNYTKKV